MLWGASAGRCSNPDCGVSLIELIAGQRGAYNIGEMAHIIGKRQGAARTQDGAGPDTFDNLILLCPNCHTHIDTYEERYPAELLRDWKETHLRRIGALDAEKFESWEELRQAVSILLAENRALFDAYGPKSPPAQMDPFSNSADYWEVVALSSVSPTNLKIVKLMDANTRIIPKEVVADFGKFKAHVVAYQRHLVSPLEHYETFPAEFGEHFK